MKVSVLIIAHNEGHHIGECIESLLFQTRKPNEIILINHNSSDDTGAVARGYPVRVIDYEGPHGPEHARIKGFEEVKSDIILCIDGDAIAHRKWIETMSDILAEPGVVMAGSWIRMKGNWFLHLASWRWYLLTAFPHFCRRSDVGSEFRASW
ncbi:MAG: glycosyl transferase [Parcubacteria group bacterium]|nr:glycosyl transferase [Parcubacteria group bacterium]